MGNFYENYVDVSIIFVKNFRKLLKNAVCNEAAVRWKKEGFCAIITVLRKMANAVMRSITYGSSLIRKDLINADSFRN